jgi:predicted small secreted protein
MKITKLLVLAAVASFALAACDSDDGMAEKAGQTLDNAGDSIKNAATDAGNAIEDACEDVKKSADAKNTNC